jgi:hypothetical protein
MYREKTFQVLKNFQFFFFTVYRVHGAVVGGNFSLIREYSSTVKNRRNCVKGLKYIWKNRDPNLKQSINSGTKRTHFQWQSVFSAMEQTRQFRDKTYGDVKMLGYNRCGRIIWGRNARGCIILVALSRLVREWPLVLIGLLLFLM